MYSEFLYKEEIKRYNKVLNYYVDIFKKKYSTSIDINVSFNEKMIELNMIGMGADEFHSLRRIKQPVGSHYIEINNHIELKLENVVSYDYFEKTLMRKLLYLKKAKHSCKLKKKF